MADGEVQSLVRLAPPAIMLHPGSPVANHFTTRSASDSGLLAVPTLTGTQETSHALSRQPSYFPMRSQSASRQSRSRSPSLQPRSRSASLQAYSREGSMVPASPISASATLPDLQSLTQTSWDERATPTSYSEDFEDFEDPSVSMGEKRTLTREEIRRIKKAKKNAERANLRDYKDNYKLYRVLSLACTLLKVTIATKTPFPSDEERAVQAQDSFAAALSSFKLDSNAVDPLDIDMIRLVQYN